ncbi:glycoside hydrolase family 127 protein, partial [bacterium]|nr:glycoside hydrolase family 127 protein [bacterium]
RKIGSVEVYWFDDTGAGQCRVPQSWTALYRVGDRWEPVKPLSEAGVKLDQFNSLRFTPVETTAIRLEVKLQDKFSGGILEMRVGD